MNSTKVRLRDKNKTKSIEKEYSFFGFLKDIAKIIIFGCLSVLVIIAISSLIRYNYVEKHGIHTTQLLPVNSKEYKQIGFKKYPILYVTYDNTIIGVPADKDVYEDIEVSEIIGVDLCLDNNDKVVVSRYNPNYEMIESEEFIEESNHDHTE